MLTETNGFADRPRAVREQGQLNEKDSTVASTTINALIGGEVGVEATHAA